MADLSQLMKIAPLSGAFMTGQQQSSDMATDEVKRQQLAQWVQELQLKNQQSQVMNPLLAAHQGLQNQTLEAGLPEVVAKGRQATAKATLDEQTLPSTVAQVNTKNTTDVSKLQGEDTNRFVQELTSYGSALENIPAPMRTQALTQMLRQSGRDPTNPMVQQWIQAISADPANMPARMKQMATAMGQTAAQANPAYHQAMDVANEQSRSHLKGIEMQGQNALAVTNAQIAAGRFAKKEDAKDFVSVVEKQIAAAKGDPVKTYTILIQNAQLALNGGNTALASGLMQRAETVKATAQAAIAKTNPNQVNPEGMGFQKNEPPALTAPLVAPGQGQVAAPPPIEGKTATGAKFKITKTP